MNRCPVADIPWTWIGIRASGITAWSVLTAVIVWGVLLKTQLLGRFAAPLKLLDLHRWLGVLALGFLVLHLGLLIIDPSVSFTIIEILVPGLAPWQTIPVALGTVAFWLLIPVSMLGRLRAKMGVVGNRWFSRAHLAAYAAWPIATAHYVLAGTDALAEWSIGLLITGSALVVMGLVARGFIPAPGPKRPVTNHEPVVPA